MKTFVSIALLTLAAPVLAGLAAADDLGKQSESVVKFTTKLEKSAGGKATALITLEIEPGWHLYANPPGNEEYASNAVTVRSAGGKIDVRYPPGKDYVDEFKTKVKVYQGTVQIRAAIDLPATGTVDLTVAVQACTDGEKSRCLPPSKVKLTVK